MLFKEMMFDMSVTDLGGSLATRVEDVMLGQYDKEFDLVVDVTSTTVFLNGEKDIVVKLHLVQEYLVVPEECSQILDLPSMSSSEFSPNDENSPPATYETLTMNINESHTLGNDTDTTTDFVDSEEDSSMFQPRFHSTQKSKRLRVEQSHLLSRETELSSASVTSKKLPSEVCETDLFILTLLNEGEEEWEINQHIVAAMRAGKLSQHINAFILVCAKHLLKTVTLDKRLNQRKSIYKRYAQMIVKQHPCLADNNCEDNYLTVKHKVVRAVGNQIDSKKHGRIHNLKRNQQKASAKRNSGGLNQYDAANSISGNLSTAVDDDFPDHESEEQLRRKHDFEATREFFKINNKLSLAKLLEKTPHYHDFEKAYDDFLMMYPMSCITEEKFQKAFESTLLTFRRFLERNSDKGGQKWADGAKMDLEVLLAVNALCSTSRGVKGAKPVFLIREVQ
ncbi:uncharacterized protein LOC116935271 isoform X2 [Daphnia magna]|uniref:uncharacterized protein LOC116935271 isoform X2 n=1 Tax=Daphnia magna TaxID=35525 RepID=UPI001E1BBD64|nr:uncharacterized protein LOC116935271 isoform X2 [Daphnia magna]